MSKPLNPACSVKIFQGTGEATGKYVIVATDLTSRTTVANQIEAISTDIIKRMKVQAKDLIFIEHRQSTPQFEETFDLIELTWRKREKAFSSPKWSPFTKEQTEAITGKLAEKEYQMQCLKQGEKEILVELNEAYREGRALEADDLRKKLDEVRSEIYELTGKGVFSYQRLPN